MKSRRALVDRVAIALLRLEIADDLRRSLPPDQGPPSRRVDEATEHHWASWSEFMRDAQRERAKALLNEVGSMIVKYYTTEGS